MSVAAKPSFLPRPVVILLRAILIAALPLLLILVNARALMNPPLLVFEDNRPDFPPDPFGFTVQDRLRYALLDLDYLFSDKGIEFLANQRMPDGTPVHNERELSHMDDVKKVTQGLTRFGLGLIAACIVCIVLLAIRPATRPALYRALLWGSILTVALILVGLIATFTSFEWLFTEFHRLFFVGNTWIFPVSDTLIRLYPEPLWIDFFSFTFGGAFLEAIILGGVMWRLGRRSPAT